jgi:TRAP-type mannitol/chloroaromatic compound transport system permease small subunit
MSLLDRLQPWAKAVDRFNELVGHGVAWMVVVMTLIVIYDVSMRFLFQMGSVMLQELEWHLFGLVFLLGAAYTMQQEGHVRVEVIYQKLSARQQTIINIAGNLFFLAPLCVVVIWSSWPFVANSFTYAETSPDPGGLPYRWLIKSAIPAGFLLLLLQAVADSLRMLLRLQRPGKESV